MKDIILVTGATSGFGKAIAEVFAKNNYKVIITGRRKERLDEIEKELRNIAGAEISSLCFDLRKRNETFAAIASLPSEWQNISILVNNAGLALGRDYFEEADLDDWETMIDTNIKGVLYMSKAILPLMIQHKKGHIINIGSTAGKEVYEKGNVYCATKHSVNALSESMRIDLLRHKIKVTCINPGAADTEFSLVRYKGDGKMAETVYEGYTPLHANDLANITYYCASLPPHVCINDLVVTCTAQANSYYLHK